jgi:hypothetical protein
MRKAVIQMGHQYMMGERLKSLKGFSCAEPRVAASSTA